MGKGMIQEHLNNGKYLITYKFNRDIAEALIAKHQQTIKSLDQALPSLESAKSDADSNLSSIESDLDETIQDLSNCISGSSTCDDYDSLMSQVEDLQNQYLEALEKYRLAKTQLTETKTYKTSLQKKIDTLQKNMPEDVSMEVWCTDYTTNLSGEVGTIEVPGERDHILLRPGGEGNENISSPTFNGARDGQITPIMSMSAAAAFYNLAMFPGWQKWGPTYRFGKINSINHDDDTCSVSLDPEVSDKQGQGLNINQANTFSSVPIEYMTCNSSVFEIGDRVVIEFKNQNMDKPIVIGFVTEPVQCEGQFLGKCPPFFEMQLSRQDTSEVWYLLRQENELYVCYDETGSLPEGPSTEHTYSVGGVDGTRIEISSEKMPVTFDYLVRPHIPQIWDFCSNYPNHPICENGKPRKVDKFEPITLSDWWTTLRSINAQVNDNTTYEGEAQDNWRLLSFPNASGDCEDFVLTKMKLLAEKGFPVNAMDYIFCYLRGGGHAVLGIMSDMGVVYLEQSPNDPLLEYEELEDARFVTRTKDAYEFEFVDGSGSITDNSLTINEPSVLKWKTAKDELCIKYKIGPFCVIALQFHNQFSIDCETDNYASGTHIDSIYCVAYSKKADGWELLNSKKLIEVHTDFGGQKSEGCKVEENSFSFGPFSGVIMDNTDQTDITYSAWVRDLEENMVELETPYPSSAIPGKVQAEGFQPDKVKDKYDHAFYPVDDDEYWYIDSYVIRIYHPGDLQAAYSNYSIYSEC